MTPEVTKMNKHSLLSSEYEVCMLPITIRAGKICLVALSDHLGTLMIQCMHLGTWPGHRILIAALIFQTNDSLYAFFLKPLKS